MSASPSEAKSPVPVWDEHRLAAPHAQEDKSRRVRRMFDLIAPTYERVNRLASAGRDDYWRREMVRLARVRDEDVLLDVACGTGDVVRAFAEGRPAPRRLIGVDFAPGMLARALDRPVDGGHYVQADALALPLADASVTLVTCAFGVRNFQHLDRGLREMGRVLRPGGRAVILEFSVPRIPVLRSLYLWYFRAIMPRLAGWISGDRSGAYRYLPRSVLTFAEEEEIVAALSSAGFSQVRACRRTGGIVTIYVAFKGATGDPDAGAVRRTADDRA